MKFYAKAAAYLTSGALVFSTLVPAAFASTVTVAGNGAFSANDVSLNNTSTTTVEQNNQANITNNVSSDTNTGNNSASYNTGGSVGVSTGGANSATDIVNKANLNQATVSNCGTCGSNGATNVGVTGNGAYSANSVDVNNSNSTQLYQNNTADIANNVNNTANTGNNAADYNTGSVNGGGTVSVHTGSVNNDTMIRNMANANVANLGGTSAGGAGGTSSVDIAGNGAFSHNSVDLSTDNSVTAEQNNSAYFQNDVNNTSDTGDNSASYNTGTGVRVETGGVHAFTGIDNLANFNAFDSGNCGCTGTGLNAGIFGNGYGSWNAINADLGNTLGVYQGGEGAGNTAYYDNSVYGDGNTGTNLADYNTGGIFGHGTDRVSTGTSNSDTMIRNAGNVNMYGNLGGLTLPGGLNLGFSFNMHDLMNGFMGL